VTINKLLYWYTQEQYYENKLCLASFNLANILDISILPDFFYGGRKNIITIYLSSWNKKEELKGPRRFIFAFLNREEMYKWTMTLNFLRVKAIHDDFTLKFGIMNLPLKHEMKPKAKKTFKIKFRLNHNIINNDKKISCDSLNSKKSDNMKIRKGSVEYQFAKNLLNKSLSNFTRLSSLSFNLEEVIIPIKLILRLKIHNLFKLKI